MKVSKLNNKTLREKVFDKLRSKIMSANIAPGEVIKIRDLARNFGVSMMPVREALWQLESEQIIVIESNKSIFVNELDAKEMQVALQIRLNLESIAAERSCERRPDSALPKLKMLFDEMKLSTDKPKRYMKFNHQFHFFIYSFADSPLLLRIIDSLWARIGPYLFIHAQNADLSETMQSHFDMYDAFCNRDKTKIIRALSEDLRSAAAFIIPFLKQPNNCNNSDIFKFIRPGGIQNEYL